jgi:hypothetical protein
VAVAVTETHQVVLAHQVKVITVVGLTSQAETNTVQVAAVVQLR